MSDDVKHDAVDALLAYAVEWSGCQAEGIAREAVRRAFHRELARGRSATEVMRRAAEGDPELVRELRFAISVRETFLFRHPEQFDLIAAHAPSLAADGVLRSWSAGCATGEETWSLAATLAASFRDHDAAPRLAILGTDIYEPGLEVARAGVYRASSIRPSGPLLYPTVSPVGSRFEVLAPLRQLATFVAHDLRDQEPGQFEIILCRNVLIYFSPAAAKNVLARLSAALAPGGLIVFGTMDVDAAELAGLCRVGRPELMAFTNRPARPRRRPTTRRPPLRAKTPTLPPEAVALHRSALIWIELGGHGSAETVLADLNRRFPDYLPGMLERALLHVRKGEHAHATEWMRTVLHRAEALQPDRIVPGLEALPAAFYRDAAHVYLARAGQLPRPDKEA